MFIMNNISQTPYQLLISRFTIKSLKEIYSKKIKLNKTKGVDRLNGIQFERQSKQQIKVIHEKCLAGTYKFSPYLELLRSKGREKFPRILAIPTVRDRIVLCALKEILFEIFSDAVQRELANTYIYNISDYMKDKDPSNVGIFRADIQDFYPSIDRSILMKILNSRIKSNKILTLIKRAIETPIVPQNYRKIDFDKYLEDKGIPQGLSVSNILASIYLIEVDKFMKSYTYFRYVDDILIFTTKCELTKAEEDLKTKIKELKLSFNDDKTSSIMGNEEFEYLGYRFAFPKVTVRQSPVERFLNSITAKFSKYIHTRNIRLKKFDKDQLKRMFILGINEKITGAISGDKRYGWIFYFSAINDLSVLHKLDKIVASLFGRLVDFNESPPADLKKLSRAYYEAKYSPTSGYTYNYNNNETVTAKSNFLIERGKLDPSEVKSKSPEEIIAFYEYVKQKNLSELQRDDAHVYQGVVIK